MQTQPILSHADAMIVVNAVRESLEKNRLSAVVAVVDAHGELLALLRTDGARLTSINIAISKAYTAAREQTPSKVIGQRSRDEGFPMTNFGGFGYVTWGGGLPISVDGQVMDLR